MCLTSAISLLHCQRMFPAISVVLSSVPATDQLAWSGEVAPASKNPIVASLELTPEDLLSMISEGIEPSTFSVLTKCDNRYTMKPCETHGRPWVAAKAARPRYVPHVTYSLTYQRICLEHNIFIHQSPVHLAPVI
jgi:hypothetical protein